MSMWGALGHLKSAAQSTLEKAKAAAADLEGQLDASVGIEGQPPPKQLTRDSRIEDDGTAWADEFPLDNDLEGTTTSSSPSTTDAAIDSDFARASMDTKLSEPITISRSDSKASFVPHVLEEEERNEVQPFEGDPCYQERALDGGWKEDRVDENSNRVDEAPKLEQSAFTSETMDSETLLTDEVVPPTEAVSEARQTEMEATNAVSSTDALEKEEDSGAPVEVQIANQFNNLPKVPLEDQQIRGKIPFEEAVDATMTSSDEISRMQQQLVQLQSQLKHREEKILEHTQQMTAMLNMHEAEKRELEQRVENTKDEARRRLAKAKERLDEAEQRAASVSNSSSESVIEKDEIIAALREEGGKLANKQMEMEQVVRAAKGEARELREQLEAEEVAKENALGKISQLEAELKSTRTDLVAARKGESQASKLENDLHTAREDSESKAAKILALEQQVKELKSSSKQLVKELEAARKGAELDSQREQKKLLKEHNSILEDLENKLRTTEKEAAVREDALRHEVSELRKRWQDAVRRADSLSMDVQSSTAPLLRQLESLERQNRTRATAWAELENKLRQELEEAIEGSERMQREQKEIMARHSRQERQLKDLQQAYSSLQNTEEDKTKKIGQLQENIKKMQSLHEKQKKEWDEVQRLANEGVARVRSEMTQTLVEAEERHVSQIDSMKKELQQEHEKRRQLEEQVQGLLEKATSMVLPVENGDLSEPGTRLKAGQARKLNSATGQVEILVGALSALNDDDNLNVKSGNNRGIGGVGQEDDDEEGEFMELHVGGSFAALEELQSRFKVAKIELQALRTSLSDSEKTREKLVSEMAEARNAKEKLPLFEKKVAELTSENNQMSLEIQGLQDDIAEVRELYRAQLNVLLEEKAATATRQAENHLESSKAVSSVEGNHLAELSTVNVPTTKASIISSNEDFEELRLAKQD